MKIPSFTGKAVYFRLDEINMKDIDQIINDAAHRAVHPERRHKYLTDYAKGIPTDAKDALKEAYLIRQTSFADPRWVDIYAKFMIAMEDRWDTELGIEKFRALAFTTKGMEKKTKEYTYDTK